LSHDHLLRRATFAGFITLSSGYLLPNLTVTRLEQSPVSTTQT
jgi:hypothetical protein